jgi:hypothetical protein
MSYFKERIPELIDKYKKNIDYLESIIEDNGQDADEDGLGLGNEKAVNIIKAKKEARLELSACYDEVERLESILHGTNLIKDTTNLHPSKKFANKE